MELFNIEKEKDIKKKFCYILLLKFIWFAFFWSKSESVLRTEVRSTKVMVIYRLSYSVRMRATEI